jgi:hypothetical protein
MLIVLRVSGWSKYEYRRDRVSVTYCGRAMAALPVGTHYTNQPLWLGDCECEPWEFREPVWLASYLSFAKTSSRRQMPHISLI